MTRFHNPTVLVTRPRESSERFLAALATTAGPFVPLIVPAFETVATDAVIDPFDTAIFTSRAGVAFAPVGTNRVAYCVGDATAAAARDVGYIPISAEGAASDLVTLIFNDRPSGRLMHFRGETSVGNVAATLQAVGLICQEVIVYRKEPSLLAPQTATQIKATSALIIPLFSAETVSIVARWNIDFTTSRIVAISEAVAVSAQQLNPSSITISDHPDLAEMAACTSRLIA